MHKDILRMLVSSLLLTADTCKELVAPAFLEPLRAALAPLIQVSDAFANSFGFQAKACRLRTSCSSAHFAPAPDPATGNADPCLQHELLEVADLLAWVAEAVAKAPGPLACSFVSTGLLAMAADCASRLASRASNKAANLVGVSVKANVLASVHGLSL